MKNNIQRDDFKYNFLKKIVIRIDYTGMLELDLETTLLDLKRYLYQKGFVNFEESYIKELEFNLQDPEEIETQLMIPISELRKNKAYKFSTDDESKSLKITRFFATISIDTDKYINFEKYGEIFSEIVEILKNNNKFIRILRLGLRKINNCILLDISKLNDFFEEEYFSNFCKNNMLDKMNTDIFKSEKADYLYIDDENVNLIRLLLKGVLKIDEKQKEAYQVILDIDVYNNDKEILKTIINDNENVYEKLEAMNHLSFKLYIQMLKREFIEQLKTDGVDEGVILEVEKND